MDEPVRLAPKLDEGATDPERYGAAARTLLGMSLAQQATWHDPRRALNAWIDAVSELDVLVLQAQSIPIQEMRGFSISTDRLPVIVRNSGDVPRGRIFTLLHEFAHVLLHADVVCDVLPRQFALRCSDARADCSSGPALGRITLEFARERSQVLPHINSRAEILPAYRLSTPAALRANEFMEPTEVNANRSAWLPGGQISLDDSA
ncbi:MAG TPA: ImmA/IrrE family metallo-endopeptidase [Solirubrobacteraceae bacterium]|jgi:hypothetical protein|nr:ImmA/IrrE family metallo-endopeptidase [Solirubrobacteraceae bacterium]